VGKSISIVGNLGLGPIGIGTDFTSKTLTYRLESYDSQVSETIFISFKIPVLGK
jgi:hypothetical protein